MKFEERLAELHRELDGLAVEAARERGERLRGLQLASRALRQAESTGQWVEILADAAAPLAGEVLFFEIEGGMAVCRASRGRSAPAGEIPLATAPALYQAAETKETVVSLYRASQLSALVAPESAESRRRAHLFPLVGRTRVLGVLLAAGDGGPDVFALEILLALAAATLELREPKAVPLIGVAAPAPLAGISAATPSPVQTSEPRPPRQFARATVARWIVEMPGAVADGRTRADLYAALREPIDQARSHYRKQFSSGPDRLHEEMVRQLAGGDPRRLGASYPGPLAMVGNA